MGAASCRGFHSSVGQSVRLLTSRSGVRASLGAFFACCWFVQGHRFEWLPSPWASICAPRPSSKGSSPGGWRVFLCCASWVWPFSLRTLGSLGLGAIAWGRRPATCFLRARAARVSHEDFSRHVIFRRASRAFCQLRYSLAGQDTRPSPERPGFESRWRKKPRV